MCRRRYVPATDNDDPPGGTPVNVTTALVDPPPGMVPSGCGSGTPLTAPSLACVNCAFCADVVPVLLTVIVARTVVAFSRTSAALVVMRTSAHVCEHTN